MAPLDYVAGALEAWPLYVLLALLFLLLHGWLIKRWAVGIFDPLALILAANAFSWTIVWFMYLNGDIALRHLVYFVVAQLALYAGIGMARLYLPGAVSARSAAHDANLPALTLAMAAAVHVAATLTIWAIAGIPLFRASRLGAFHGSGGLGVLERLADSSGLIALFATVCLFACHPKSRRNIFVYTFIAWFALSIAMSGSKGALLSSGQQVMSALFLYTGLRFRRDRFWGGRAGLIVLVLSTVFALGVLTAQQDSDLTIAALALAYRVMSYGDVYIYAYPNETLELLQGDNAFIGMFGGFLSTFRLFPVDWLYPAMGVQFTGIVFPNLDQISGPNPQHPVFGFHYFGHMGFLYSFLLGLLTTAAQTQLYFRQHTTFFSGMLSFMAYFAVVGISWDLEYALSNLANLVIGCLVIVVPVLLLRPRAVLLTRWRLRSATVAETSHRHGVDFDRMKS